jgi:hypothetical protein
MGRPESVSQGDHPLEYVIRYDYICSCGPLNRSNPCGLSQLPEPSVFPRRASKVNGGVIFLLTRLSSPIPSMGDTTLEWLLQSTKVEADRRARW